MKPEFSKLGKQVGVAAVYFAAGKLGLTLAYSYPLVSPLWPATGLALAAVLVWGYGVWPGIALGAFLVNATALQHQHIGLWGLSAASVGIALGNTLEALSAGWLVNRYAQGRRAFQQPQSVLLFVALAAVGATALSATVGVAVSGLSGVLKPGMALGYWVTWWLGDMIGALTVTPLLVVWSGSRPPRLSRRRVLEGASLVLLVVLACELAFGHWPALGREGPPLGFLMIPLVLWAALRFGLRGTTVLTLLVTCLAAAGTVASRGPFVLGNPNDSLLLLQNFIALLSIVSLLLAADVVQRQRLEAAVRESELQHRELFDSNPQPMWVVDNRSLRFLAVNRAALEQYGYSREEFLNMAVTDIRPPEDVPKAVDAIVQGRLGIETPGPWRHRKKDGALLDVEVCRRDLQFDGRPAMLLLCTDITRRKQAELRAAAFSELGYRLSAALTPKAAARVIVEAADLLLGWDACCVQMCAPDPQSIKTVLSIDTIDGQRNDVTAECKEPRPTHYAREVLERGACLVLRRPGEAFPPEVLPFGDKTRPSASLMFVPVRRETHAIGVLSIQSYTPNAYTEEHLKLLQALADHCGGALEHIRAATEIQRLNRELRHHLEELQTVFNTAPVGLALAHDPQCRSLTGNPTCAAMLGLSPRAARSGTGSYAPGVKLLRAGKEVPPGALPMQVAARTGEPVTGQELELVSPDGHIINSYASASPLYDESGKVRGSLGVFVDITAQKEAQREILRLNAELERRVRERTAQLEAVNRELEAFCYSVSHDLRAPLRSIRGFSEVLLQRYAEKLDAKGQEFLRRACDSSQHMDRLIEDLLQLSRLGRAALQPRGVDLSGLAADLAAELRQAQPERQVEVIIAPGLRVKGDERLLRIALQNLLSNAWKFTTRQSRPCVEVGVQPSPPRTFFVRDNGAGFDMNYAGKLFGVFQRLHSSSEFPGTGIGLATVQRIINRHGGRIWAEGKLNQGATFYFRLPSEALFE
jgi:PAS domain S-box-containing protein